MDRLNTGSEGPPEQKRKYPLETVIEQPDAATNTVVANINLASDAWLRLVAGAHCVLLYKIDQYRYLIRLAKYAIPVYSSEK